MIAEPQSVAETIVDSGAAVVLMIKQGRAGSGGILVVGCGTHRGSQTKVGTEHGTLARLG